VLGCVAGASATSRAGLRLAAVAAALLVGGLAWGGLRLDALASSPLSAKLDTWADARVVVTGPARRTRFATRLPAEVVRFDGVPLRERVLLELPAERAPPAQGAVLELRARPERPRGPETGFDERGWLARRGVHVVLRGRGPREVGRRGGIGGVADRLRAHVAETLAVAGEGERHAVLAGVVLGADEGIDDELRDAFRASGLYHLLAVSGGNVAVVAMLTLGLARLVGVGRLGAEACAVVAIVAYALAVGWQPSVVRAAVAGGLGCLTWLTARPSDRWHFMAIGALVLLAWTPATLLEPGFQLSFVAVASIFVAVPRLRSRLEGYPVPGWVAGVVAVAVACSASTAPILVLQFGNVPVWSVPANALAEPAMPPLLVLGLLASLVEPLAPGAAASLVWLAGWCAAWLAFCARLVASLPYAQTGSTLLVLAVGAAAAVLWGLRRLPSYARRRAVLRAVPLALVVVLGWWALRPAGQWEPPLGLRVTFLDVGQGDATLLEVPGGGILVDEGPPEANVAGQLRSLGVRSLSAVVLTHPQRDHVGGAADVLRRLRVGAVLEPALLVSGREHDAALAAALRGGVPVLAARAGEVYTIGRLRVRVLWPEGPGAPGEDPNVNAIVLLVSYGRTDVLLTADAESDVTSRLPLRAVELLKVAHHGSADPGLQEQLSLLRPRIAVISVGADNDYGHPRAETLAALERLPGLRVFRTDRHGRVVVESDGTSLTVRTTGGVR
jgi:competence protein ComEC